MIQATSSDFRLSTCTIRDSRTRPEVSKEGESWLDTPGSIPRSSLNGLPEAKRRGAA
jgi:hypothetical protein